MIPEISHFFLMLAFAASLVQTILPLWGSVGKQDHLHALASPMQILSSITTVLAFAGLVYSFVTSDFSLALVAQHSHSLKPMIYKVSGVWGNHEGSLLLWIVVLGLYGGVFACTKQPLRFKGLVLMVHGAVSVAFLSFALFTSNPFTRLENAPIEGLGLNPILQDIGLAIHPPMLYLGYVGLALAFAFAVVGLIQGRIDTDWGRRIRPWVAMAWCCLSAGIVLGSWWAYYELGWGGWWFWDPVENASLMPWFIATALLHSVIIVEKRGLGQSWAVLLAILGFSLSLMGTFIVRSGLLTSVHSFAADPSRGVFILIILVFAIGIPLVLYMINGPKLQPRQQFSIISRETALIVNNFLLISAAAVVFLGTFYPLGLEILNGTRITVGPPFFDSTILPIMALGVIGMVIGAGLAWKHGWRGRSIAGMGTRICLLAAIAAVVAVFFAMGFGYHEAAPLAGIALMVWLFVGILTDLLGRLKLMHAGRWQRWKQNCQPQLGMWFGHLGIALFMMGALGEALGQSENIVRAKVGDKITLGSETVLFTSIKSADIDNYTALRAALELRNTNGDYIATLTPERRNYPAERQSTTEAAIHSSLSGDYYMVLGDGNPEIGYSLRLYHKPLLPWLWIGGTVMVLGGLSPLLRRRRMTVQPS